MWSFLFQSFDWEGCRLRGGGIEGSAAAKSLQSCPTLCNLIDGSPPGPAVPGTLQARTLEWVAISSSNAWKWKVKVKSLSRVRLFGPMDCSLPGSSVHGIFQARVLEWVAIAFSNRWLSFLLCNILKQLVDSKSASWETTSLLNAAFAWEFLPGGSFSHAF